ncbi:MAG: DUF503 domain-containing protein [candidate division KSB1 bacterium]|nr:DUF503 domain-containing protein [candidate division KSB1 bacterium]MDZ7303493.1 DUF503 domain-containing protein [candidate division KSB1 bacterium]MDZ7312705.1 DUF503 domain-containing protein [candidate division KSB1 bacterium]
MFIGVFQVEIFLPQSDSLKAKRFVLNSLKTKIRNKFNVSIAEVDHNDLWQRATLGLALVTNERKFVDQAFAKILQFFEGDDRLEVLDHRLEIY